MSRKLVELAAEIVQAQASAGASSVEEIEAGLVRVYNTLFHMQKAEEAGKCLCVVCPGEAAPQIVEPPPAPPPPPVDPKTSIGEEKVSCLECGAEFRQLTVNHLRAQHGLTPREYKKKWGLPLRQPLAATSLTRMRSESAKKRGIPAKLQAYLDSRSRAKAEAAAPPPDTRPKTKRIPKGSAN